MPGVPAGCPVKILTGVFGLPDAHRAWWMELSCSLRAAGFRGLDTDPTFFCWRHGGEGGALGAMVVVHVDDLLVATDGSHEAEQSIGGVLEKYKVGPLTWLIKEPEAVAYTGKGVAAREQTGPSSRWTSTSASSSGAGWLRPR